MPDKYFKVTVHPKNYSGNSEDEKKVVTMAPWKHNFVKLGKVNVIGRNLWRAKDPEWKNEVIYYNTEQMSLKLVYKRIIVHHTDNGDGISDVENKQRGKGYACLGYHYFVRKQGDVYEGRPLEIMGSNAGAGKKTGPLNDPDWGSIGIALQGDYHGWWSDDIKQKQLDALKTLIIELQTAYNINILLMHREVIGRSGDKTVCPGEHMAPKIKKLRTELKMKSS